MKSDVVAFCEHHKDKIIRFFNVGEYKYDVIPEFEVDFRSVTCMLLSVVVHEILVFSFESNINIFSSLHNFLI